MKVGVNLLWLVPGDVGGSEEYTVRLLQAVADARPDDLDVTLLVLRPFAEAHPALAAAFPLLRCPLEGGSRAARIIAESTWLADAARRERFDLVHHAGGTIPFVRTAPAAVTIHDLQPLELEGTFSASKQRYLRRRLPVAARRSRVVVTTSAFVRDGVVRRFGVPAARVVLAPPPIEAALLHPGAPELRARYGLGAAWFVYPAITYPHKDHLTLVRAFAEVARTHADVSLVLTGRADRSEAEVMSEVDRLGLSGRVVRTGRIPRADLDGLVAHAVALAYPSRYEGFGVPVLEAMAAGCPTIVSDAAALPEVAGDAGIVVPAGDVAAWAGALARLLDDEGQRARLRVLGWARSAEFTPAASADRLVDAYRIGASKL